MEIIVNKIRCKNVGMKSRVKLYMILSFVSVVPLLLTEGMNIYADVEIVKIGKKCV